MQEKWLHQEVVGCGMQTVVLQASVSDDACCRVCGGFLRVTVCGEQVISRLAATDGVGGDTGVKPQHQLRNLPTVPHHHSDFFFYSNKNNLVQLENRHYN